MGLATMQEIRNALSVFRRSGKFIVSHSDFYTQSSYYLSSVADQVSLNRRAMSHGVEWLREPCFTRGCWINLKYR